MAEAMSLHGSELCPLRTRLLPKELSFAFGVADDTFDTGQGAADRVPEAAAAVQALDARPVSAGARAEGDAGGLAADAGPAAAATGPGAAAGGALQPADAALKQEPSSSQATAPSSSQARPPGVQAAAVPFRGFPAAAYIGPHTLLPYGQQAVAAVPSLSGSLGVPSMAVYSPADYSAVGALQRLHAAQAAVAAAAAAAAQQQQQATSSYAGDADGDEQQARALKRPRLVWTAQLHKLFEEAVLKIGINKAVPKTIMQMMNVDGLTRENVASHLQKYRLSLRKGPDGEFITTVTEGTETSGLPNGGGGGTGDGAAAAAAEGQGAAAGAAATADAAVGGSDGSAGAAAGAGGVSSDAAAGAVAAAAGEGAEAASAPPAQLQTRAPAAAAGAAGQAPRPDGAEQPPAAAQPQQPPS